MTHRFTLRPLGVFALALVVSLVASMAPVSIIQAQSGNLVTNGDFSLNAQSWNPDALSGTETCCAYDSGGFSGGAVPNAFAHPNGAGGITALWQNIPNPQAGSYSLTGWIKTSGGVQNALIQADDGTGRAYCISQQQRNPSAWLQASCTFTLASPATIHVALIASNASGTGGGWITWDNISLTRGGGGGGTTSISGLSPAPPNCALRSSTNAAARTLTVTGSNFPSPRSTENLQFRRADTLAESIYIGSQVNWQSASQVSVDMGSIAQFLWSDSRLALQVRFTRFDPPTNGQVPISAWSSAQFLLANDSAACGGGTTQPAPSLKGAYWLDGNTNYFTQVPNIGVQNHAVAWNLDMARVASHGTIVNLHRNYQIRTLLRIGDNAKPNASELSAVNNDPAAAGQFNCNQISTLMGALDTEAALVTGNATIAQDPQAIAAVILGNEPNLKAEWQVSGRGYARIYTCYKTTHWSVGSNRSYPLLVAGPGGCRSGTTVYVQACPSFYTDLFGYLSGEDGFTIHAYGATTTTFVNDSDPNSLSGFVDQANRIDQSRPARPSIYITEYNMGSAPWTPPAGTTWAQYFTNNYNQVIQYNSSHSGQIKALIYFVDTANNNPQQWGAVALSGQTDGRRQAWLNAP